MIFLFFIAFFISLFILYSVSRHDFVLLRQSINLRTVFDNAFICLVVFLLSSRIFYILYAGLLELFNPLKFLYFTSYWGILPYAGIICVLFTILFLYRKRKNKLRILDIYFISFTPIIILDVLLYGNGVVLMSIKLISVLVLLAFYFWFIKIHNKFTTKDGFIAMLILITYSLVSLALSLASFGFASQSAMVFNLVIIVVVIVSTIVLGLIQKDTFNKQ